MVEKMTKKGLVFFDSTNMDKVLDAIGWNEDRVKHEKCAVCGCSLTKDTIGGLTRHSPIKAVCKKFNCIMSVLLTEKKESLK